MTKMVQIRNVPDDVHRVLRERASAAGMSLSEYLLRELRILAAHATLEEVLDDAAAHALGDFSVDDVVEAIHAGRARR